MPRCIDAKSVTEINFVNSGDEHESIVGWGCYPNNETDLDVKMRRCMGCFKKKSFDYFAAVLNYNQLDSFAVARNDVNCFCFGLIVFTSYRLNDFYS